MLVKVRMCTVMKESIKKTCLFDLHSKIVENLIMLICAARAGKKSKENVS